MTFKYITILYRHLREVVKFSFDRTTFVYETSKFWVKTSTESIQVTGEVRRHLRLKNALDYVLTFFLFLLGSHNYDKADINDT